VPENARREALFAGTTCSTVRRWEKGHVRPSKLAWKAIQRLARERGVALDETFLPGCGVRQSDYVKCGLMEVFEVMVAPLGDKFDRDTVAAVDGVVKGMRYGVFRQCGERVLATMRSTLRPAQVP